MLIIIYSNYISVLNVNFAVLRLFFSCDQAVKNVRLQSRELLFIFCYWVSRVCCKQFTPYRSTRAVLIFEILELSDCVTIIRYDYATYFYVWLQINNITFQ